MESMSLESSNSLPTIVEMRRSSGRPNWMIPILLFFAAVACLPIDVSVASFFKSEHKQLPKYIDSPLREALENCEVFGHGFGAFLIVMAVAVLAPSGSKPVPWLLAGSWGAGLVANTFKTLVFRTRPRAFDFEAKTVWATFAHGTGGGMNVQSFPSAHTATAVGLAVMLASLFPRGRWYFVVLASCVGLQRVVCSAHFPSDVLAGATIGWLVGAVCANAMVAYLKKSGCEQSSAISQSGISSDKIGC